jgi:hypothetical protein
LHRLSSKREAVQGLHAGLGSEHLIGSSVQLLSAHLASVAVLRQFFF